MSSRDRERRRQARAKYLAGITLLRCQLLTGDDDVVQVFGCPDCASEVESAGEFVPGVEHVNVYHSPTCPRFTARKSDAVTEYFNTN